jgi:ABC-type Mn2+/Zn2+ transport system ATPase subunit
MVSANEMSSSGDAATRVLLSACHLVVGYEGKALLPRIDALSIASGQAWCVLGRNGAGKTTLLRTLTGLLPPVSGELVRDSALRLGYVPQRSDVDALVPWRVHDLVASGADRGWGFFPWGRAQSERAAISRLLDELDLTGLSQHPYRSLSEGQKQRVLLARGLVSAPSLLVLDEPTASMDVENERAVFRHLERIKSDGTALLFITHDLEHAARLATHAVFVDKDDGVVKADTARTLFRDAHVVQRLGALYQLLSGDDDETPHADEQAGTR